MQLTPEFLNISDHLPTILTWSVYTFLLSVFLDFCFSENNIFEGWLNFWAKWWLKKNKPKLLKKYQDKTDNEVWLENPKYETVREYLFSEVEWFWFKPLGACVVCMNVWICFALAWTQGNVISVLAMILLSNFLVRFSNEKLL